MSCQMDSAVLSQPCTDKAMQCDQPHQLSVVLYRKESDLPWRSLHLLQVGQLLNL